MLNKLTYCEEITMRMLTTAMLQHTRLYKYNKCSCQTHGWSTSKSW